MKVSELIKLLQVAKAQYGDLNVTCWNGDDAQYCNVFQVKLGNHEDQGGNFLIVTDQDDG